MSDSLQFYNSCGRMKNPNSDQILVVVNGGYHPQTSESLSSTEILDVATGKI